MKYKTFYDDHSFTCCFDSERTKILNAPCMSTGYNVIFVTFTENIELWPYLLGDP